ncbi:GNAT family N-acetyltransferase [Angustibacter peucedani]
MQVEQLARGVSPDVLEMLADVLVDCVDGGASVGFLAGLTAAEAQDWWRRELADDGALTWVAVDDGRVLGCVRLLLARPANAPHRAEVSKLLVHRDARGRGAAGALLDALEAGARELGRSLLVLDTQTGSPAEGLYRRRGWQPVGTVEGYALTPRGELAPTTVMARTL